MTFLTRRHFLAATTASAALPHVAKAGQAATETDRLNAWLEERFQTWIARSPMGQGYLGLKTNTDKWDDISEAQADSDLALSKQDLADLRRLFKPAALNDVGRMSYRLYAYESEHRIANYRWRHHEYPVNQMFGWQQTIPTFLINMHRVESTADAQAYIARLVAVDKLMDQVIDKMRRGEAAGVLAPKFVYANVIRDCRNLLGGAPFASGKDSVLLEDIKTKIDALKIDDSAKQKLRADAQSALTKVLGPAFQKLVAFAEAQAARAGTQDGVWHLPDGEAYYAHCLKYQTTTDMTPDQIHEFGLRDVARIHAEMRAIMKQVKFDGDLKAFFAHLHTDPQFFFAQSDDGKKAYVARAHEIVDAMKIRLGDMFGRQPKAELTIKVVEPFREESSTSAFYEPPGAFDKRPGVFYVNTFDMKTQPKYDMESLTYHEAVPGHHMQISISQEMDDLPKFRRFADGYTAYVEGWALYCERMPKDFGFYQDPYSDFGRLNNELWRAVRLVVDTGLHGTKWKWSREQAIAYMRENTPNSEQDCANSAERYIVMPGQATSYKIGMTKIFDLREAAKKKLGAKFDIRAYHDLVLAAGALPLSFLEDSVNAWTAARLKG